MKIHNVHHNSSCNYIIRIRLDGCTNMTNGGLLPAAVLHHEKTEVRREGFTVILLQHAANDSCVSNVVAKSTAHAREELYAGDHMRVRQPRLSGGFSPRSWQVSHQDDCAMMPVLASAPPAWILGCCVFSNAPTSGATEGRQFFGAHPWAPALYLGTVAHSTQLRKSMQHSLSM